ncbi:unnamed protein product [Arabidopsis halleri]
MILEGPNFLTVMSKHFQVRVFILVSLMVSTISNPSIFPSFSILYHGDHLVYSLYGVVVHLDAMSTSFSGHYV